jgi:CheY-like chemotaxis protein
MAFTILLVDDDDVAVEAVQRSMKKAHITIPVLVAEDGQVAFDILKGNHPTKKTNNPVIVLLDINMPRMSGFEFLDLIRADSKLKNTIVFMLTTSRSDEDQAKAYNKNIAGYIVKDSVGEQFKHLFSLLDGYDKSIALPA